MLASKIDQGRFYKALPGVSLRQDGPDEAAAALQWTIRSARRALSSIPPGPERDAWIASASTAAESWAGLQYHRNGDAAEAVRAFHWQYDLQLRPSQAGTLEEYRLPGIRQGAVELGWLPVEGQLLAWVRDSSGRIQARPVTDEAALRRDATEFRRLCADPNSDVAALRRLGAALYAALIAPLDQSIPSGAAVALAPQGFLFDLPFGALVEPGGRYFAELHHLWMAAGSPRPPQGSPIARSVRALVVSAGTAGRGWSEYLPPLPNANTEARQVAAMFEGAHLLSGKDARAEPVAAELPRAEVFHFAGHTYSTASGEGLLLASGTSGDTAQVPNMLSGERVNRLDLGHCRLAVLSSCETAGPQTSPYRSNLARRFLQAGAEWVVGAGWNADSEAAQYFMGAFYRGMLNRETIPAALGAAAGTLRQSSATKHPYYWAVFRAYGPT
jgi:CHAT domain-containing protein